MKNFSEESIIDNITSKDRTIQLVRSNTGLSTDHIEKIYESQKIEGISDESIVNYFNTLAQPINNINLKDFFGSLVNGLSGIETNLTDIKKTEVTKGLLQCLNDYSTGKDTNNINLDSVQLMSIIQQLIEIKNPEAKESFSKLDSNLILSDAATEYTVLSESMNFSLPEIDNVNTVMLYEGLRDILMKNNKRWGNAYHIQNTYNAMLSFFDEEITNRKLAESMVSMDNTFHLELLNDLLSGDVSPINKDINAIKHLIPDLQTLLFDIVVLVNNYFINNEYSLNFIARQSVNSYKDASRTLIASIASSRVISKIIYDEVRDPNLAIDSNTSTICVSGENDWSKGNFLQKLSGSIDQRKLKYDTYDVPLKAIVDMLNLVKSSSVEFNLKIRPFVRNYVTKSYELCSKVERAKIERAKINR